MFNSIQHFFNNGLKELEEKTVRFADDPTKLAEYVYGVTDAVTSLGLCMIAEQLESFDEKIRNSQARKKTWEIIRRDETTLLTSLGPVKYRKTYYRHKKRDERVYLLDRLMGIDPHTRVSEDAFAKALEEAVDSSYRKGGEKACITEDVISKQAVMTKLHTLEFPPLPKAEELKKNEYLYIDADEDHVALQFLRDKGEPKEKGKRRSAMAKLVYLYEGINAENGRDELVSKVHFGGLYEGSKGNEKLWKEVDSYIRSHYDVNCIKKIYINGDGAEWIKSGTTYIPGSVFVLDKFHMHKYIIKATSHLGDGTEQARSDLYRAIEKKDRKLTKAVFDAIVKSSGDEHRSKVLGAEEYIMNNWAGIKRQVRTTDPDLRCSAEGHVSHVYSDRLSSRPLGWCKLGVDKMARLRVYRENKQSMLELVRYQRTEKAAGLEEIKFSSADINDDLARQRAALGQLYGTKLYTLPDHIKKAAGIRLRLRF